MKKILSLFIAFIMLFDLTTPIFAVAANNKEEQKLFTELTDSLEEEHQKQEDINTKLLASCLQKNNKNLCSAYLKNINELFSDTRDKIEKGKQPKEEAEPTPISQREYEKQLEENTPLEYDKAFKSIKDSFEKEKDALALKYKGISQNTQEYANYQLEMDNLEKWRKNNIENLDSWRKEVFDNKDTYYQNYLKEFQKY